MLTAAWNSRPGIAKLNGHVENGDTLPGVPFVEKADVIALSLEQQAAVDFDLRKLPVKIKDWEAQRLSLRRRIWKAAGVVVDHNVPLDYHETGTIKLNGYVIKKIYFQTRPGVYVTANLYVPEGKGPFPAVINMHGHWQGGKAGDMVQSCAHELALNGYVCLNIDAWGSGERTTVHGVHEYHGSNLGTSLMNVGETLLGAQLVDNIRGIDLLCSLKYVDDTRIGATGASGGGNQTMWLSALDDRVTACMPVVNVGTFQSYIMSSNCVCELLPSGLTFTEEAGILSLIAPRALKIVSALKDRNKAFFPTEMLRSFNNAKTIYELAHRPQNITYQLFDTTHGYWPAMRQSLLGWFALHLKGEGDGGPMTEVPFKLLPERNLMVFPVGHRDSLVVSTIDYVKRKANEELKRMDTIKFIDRNEKLSQLKNISRYSRDELKMAHVVEQYANNEKIILETSRGRLIPLHLYQSRKTGRPATLVLFTDKTDGKTRGEVLTNYLLKGATVVVADLWGQGVNNSPRARIVDGTLPDYHTLARSAFWLGYSTQGIWADEIRVLVEFMHSRFSPSAIIVDAQRETGIATLIEADLYNNIDSCVLRNCPLSYRVDDRQGIDFFDMSVHLPGIIPWGDVPLLAALSGCEVLEFRNPVSLSGRLADGEKKKDFGVRVHKEMKLAGKSSSLRFSKN